jgi:hypothetical protein
MKNVIYVMAALLFSVLLYHSSIVYSENMPSEEEIDSIYKTCAGNRTLNIEGDVKGALSVWKRQAEIKGNAKVEDLAFIILGFKDEDKRLEAYKMYTGCIKDILLKYLSKS